MEIALNKAHLALENEIEQLTGRIEIAPEATLSLAQQCLARSEQIQFPEAGIQACIVISKAHWQLTDYVQGLKAIREALSRLNKLDTDLFLPEILHLHALHFWGQAKYYSAQQFWINALEQAALVGETIIEIECLIGLGNVWRITEQTKLAMSTHALAVTVANNARLNWLEGKARILLARDHLILNDYIEMLSVLDEADEVLSSHDNQLWKAEIWDFRCLALLGLERFDDAELANAKAMKIADSNDLIWMQTHTSINRARIELIRSNLDEAKRYLTDAEATANKVKDSELLPQIYFQQSAVAEKQGEFKAAYEAFKEYRKYSLASLKEHTNRLSADKARTSKRQLDQRARKLINRIRGQVEFSHGERGYSHLVSETYWWEQMILFKSELKAPTHTAIIIEHANSAHLEVCIELAQSLCNRSDLISQLNDRLIGIIVAEKGEKAHQLFQFITQTLNSYPWERRGLTLDAPITRLHDILTFPYTLEQLIEQYDTMDIDDGKTTD